MYRLSILTFSDSSVTTPWSRYKHLHPSKNLPHSEGSVSWIFQLFNDFFFVLTGFLKFFKHSRAKVGIQLWVSKTQFILVFLLLINYCIIFHMNNCEPTFASCYIVCIQTLNRICELQIFSPLCCLYFHLFVSLEEQKC